MHSINAPRKLPDNTLDKPLYLATFNILIVIVIIGFAWRAVFIYRAVKWLTDYWLFEDYGYSLKIAKNMASGLGETFDGVVPTNGYQPLYVWLMVPVFWIFETNLKTPIYVALTLLAVANVVTGVFTFSIVRRLTKNDYWALLGAAYWMFNLAVAKDGTNGLEAGLSTMMVAATVWYFLSIDELKLGGAKAVKLGLLLGFSFLARVDGVFLAAAIFGMILWPNPASLKQRILFGVVVGASVFAIAVPYVTWNLAHFGTPLPASGLVTTGRSSLFALSTTPFNQLIANCEYGLFIIGRMIAGITTPQGVVVAGPVGGEAYIAPLVLIGFIIFASVGIAWSESGGRKGIITLSAIICIFTYGYTIYSFVPFERYYLPIVLGVAILLPTILHVVFGGPRYVLLIVVPLCAVFIINAFPYIYTRDLYTPGWYPGIRKLNEITKAGDIVAASQAGNLGYFYRNGRAINLDGVVNLDAYKYRNAGTIGEYIKKNNVKYLADEGNWIFIVADQIKSPEDRDAFYAQLAQRFASSTYSFSVYELTNVVYSSIVKPAPTDSWKKVPNNLFIEKSAIMSNTPKSMLEFIANRCFEMKFLKHDWSGIVNVYRDGILTRTVDLFSAVQDPTWRESFDQDFRPHLYTLEVSDGKNPASHGTEVWLDSILERQSCEAN
jgi:hypothetical protein